MISVEERKQYTEELERLRKECNGAFVNPKTFRRIEDLEKLLLTGDSKTKISINKGRNPQRVTSFTRDRR